MVAYIVGNSADVNADVVLHTGHTAIVRGLAKVRLPAFKSVDKLRNFYSYLPKVNCRLIIENPTKVPDKPQEPVKQEPEKDSLPQDPVPPVGEPPVVNQEPEKTELPEDWFKGLNKAQLVEKAQSLGVEADFGPMSKAEIIRLVSESV